MVGRVVALAPATPAPPPTLMRGVIFRAPGHARGLTGTRKP
jgi:hypothetical protein